MYKCTDVHREKVHQWLAAPDPSINQNEACRRRQEGTGLWFIRSKEFENWKIKPGSMLWLHGIPGCGKSLYLPTQHTYKEKSQLTYVYR